MKACTKCGAQSYREESKFCLKCGQEFLAGQNEQAQDINICTNADCQYHDTGFIYPDDAKFCDACGSPTVYNR